MGKRRQFLQPIGRDFDNPTTPDVECPEKPSWFYDERTNDTRTIRELAQAFSPKEQEIVPTTDISSQILSSLKMLNRSWVVLDHNPPTSAMDTFISELDSLGGVLRHEYQQSSSAPLRVFVSSGDNETKYAIYKIKSSVMELFSEPLNVRVIEEAETPLE